MGEVVDLGFRARSWQFEALASLKRFSVLIVHRRGGKTLAAVMKLIDSALKNQLPRARYAYIAPELKQAKAVAWDYLRHYALKLPRSSVNESELWVQLPNGARIRIYGADDPDSLRGLYFDGVVLDEVAQMKPHVWGEILLPSLSDRGGWCLFIGTPKGINLLSDVYFKAEANSEWFAKRYTISDTNALSQQELDTMRANMTDQQWRQEMLCDFDASSDETLISIDLVRSALGRHLQPMIYRAEPKVIGVDVALGGGDLTVIQTRQGLAAFAPNVLNLSDTQQIADLVAHTIDVFQPDAVFVDGSGGYGAGVINRLEALHYSVTGIQFGGQAIDERYVNRRTEMWWKVKCWLEKGASLPNDRRYLIDLTGPRYDYKNARNKLALESKDQMKARGIKSPDIGDALALTFASPVAVTNRQINGLPAELTRFYNENLHARDYDPFQRYADQAAKEFQ
jgi:hypothetical protein